MTGTRRRWELGSFRIVRFVDLRPEEHPLKISIDPFVERWLADPLIRTVVIDMSRQTTGHWLETFNLSDQCLRRAISDSFRLGLLIALSHDFESAAGSSQEVQREQTPPPPRPPKIEKTWIEFRLVDQMHRAVKNARYRLKITDGSMREGKLDADGRLRLAGIPPGTCEICFIDFAANEWRRL